MFVEAFFSREGDTYRFSHEQGSDFAKRIAGDFNPLHDPDNKRFCIPGDLLFSVCLTQFGISQKMVFDFQGMVPGGASTEIVASDDQIKVTNGGDKSFLSVQRSGEVSRDEAFTDALIRSYVAFSGKTFPHILVEVMKKEGVMVNPVKPMVIYDQMELTIDEISQQAPSVELKDAWLELNGKRGMMIMEFDIVAGGKSIGSGRKQIITSGLRDYDQSGIDGLVATYEAAKSAYFS